MERRIYQRASVVDDSSPVYRVRSKQPIEDLVRRGAQAVRFGHLCRQINAAGFAGSGAMMVEVVFEDGLRCLVPRMILRRAAQ